jgi:DNA (cytosine-5)-methyltransferase 1
VNGLDLFSGIGGLSLALQDWVKPIAYCENDRYAQSVLMSAMQRLDIAEAPIWDDVRTLRGDYLPEVDIIYGGFPCQDISTAGRGGGLAGERSGLYFEIERLVRETKPAFVFLENVPAIRTRGLGRVVWGLSELGYDCRWTVVSAQEIGAPHIRKRWFLLAHANGVRLRQEQRTKHSERARSVQPHDIGEAQALANSPGERKRKPTNEANTESIGRQTRDESFDSGWWSAEPNVGRVANGVPARVDRLRGLGNAVVPLQAKVAFERLIGIGG